MRPIRRATPWAVAPVAAAALALAAAAPGRAAVKLTPGQEFLYTGTSELKLGAGDGPGQTFSGAAQISAVVAEADPAKGYAVILMRRVQPKEQAGQPGAAGEVGVGTVRYGADLAVTQQAAFNGGPISGVLRAMSVPMSPQADLKSGQTWRRKEPVAGVPLKAVEFVSTVTGESKVGERAALKIEKKPGPALPIQQDLGGGATIELTDYTETIQVDSETGQVLTDEVHGQARFNTRERKIALDFSASVSLQESKQLSETELAARVKQAATIDRVQNAMFSPPPDADRVKLLAEASKETAAFKKEYPDSPYTPALDQLDGVLGQMRAQADTEAPSQSLKGRPAPTFALKTLAGKMQSLAAYKGKVVVLNFFASWCPPCNAEAPHLEKAFWQKYRGRGVVIVGVNTGERGQQAQLARQFRDKHALTYPILLDAGDQVSQKYGITAFPTNIVIDRKGVVRSVEIGFNPDGLSATLDQLIGKG
jgi:peroxiredoxin